MEAFCAVKGKGAGVVSQTIVIGLKCDEVPVHSLVVPIMPSVRRAFEPLFTHLELPILYTWH